MLISGSPRIGHLCRASPCSVTSAGHHASRQQSVTLEKRSPGQRPGLVLIEGRSINAEHALNQVIATMVERQYASGQHPWQARWSSAKRSGSNGGLGPLVHLPIPGKQIGDFVGGVIWKPGQHVSEPGLRIDVVHLAGFDQGIDGGGTMAASI